MEPTLKEPNRKARRNLRDAFFARHPRCCFCGGSTKATTIDHIPARAIWEERLWPEGYEFPACGKCNAITRIDELIINMLSRVYPDPVTPAGERELQRAIEGVGNNVPGLLSAMQASARQLRKAEQDGLVSREQGESLSDLPILSLNDPRIHMAVERYAIKLGCALHYLHCSKIVPPDGSIASRWFSNSDLLQGKLPEATFQVAKGIPSLRRGKRDLSDQFSYVFAVSNDTRLGFYLVRFRQSFAIAVALSMERRPKFGNSETQGPFTH